MGQIKPKLFGLPLILTFYLLLFAGLNTNGQIHKGDAATIDYQKIYEQYKKNEGPLAEIHFNESLKPEWVQTDLAIMISALKEAQTSIYRYQSKASLEQHIKNVMSHTNEPMTYIRFVRLVAGLLKKIACGHSGWSHTQAYRTYRNEHMKFFPLRIHATERHYIVKQNASSYKIISAGDTIVSINGQSPEQITKTIRNHFTRDGTSNSGSIQDVGRYFPMAYSNFVYNPDFFDLVIRKKNSNRKEIILRLAALKKKQIDSVLKYRYSNTAKRNLPLKFQLDDKDQTATYTIRSFNNDFIAYHKQEFVSFTDSIFEQIQEKQIKNLIIDIRDNSGGWTANGRKLFSYFISKPIPYVKKVELNKINDFSFEPIISKYQDTKDTMSFKRNKNNLLEWTNYHVLQASPVKNRFNGQVYILTNDMSRSCSALFSAMMRSHTNAIFIGSETGGAQCGQNGMIMAINLPYTGLNIYFSTAQYTANVKDISNTRGVIPDYEVPTTWEDIEQDKDPQMEFVRALIKKQK